MATRTGHGSDVHQSSRSSIRFSCLDLGGVARVSLHFWNPTADFLEPEAISLSAGRAVYFPIEVSSGMNPIQIPRKE